MMTAARRKDGSKGRPSDSMPVRTASIRPPLASRTCAAVARSGMIIVRPNSSSRPEMNNPEITSTRVLTGTSRKTRAKAFSQTEGFRHLFGSTRIHRFSMLSRLPSKLLERGIRLPGPCTHGQPAARDCRAAVRRTHGNDRSQAGRFCAGAMGSCRRDVPYAGRHRGSFGPKHSGWRQAPFPVCGIMGPWPDPGTLDAGLVPAGAGSRMTVVKSLRPWPVTVAPETPLTRRRRGARALA